MKKSAMLLLAGAMAFTQLNAQTEQGTLLIGGNLGFSTSSSTNTVGDNDPVDGPKYTDFSIAPFAGYFLADNLVVGLSVGHGSSSVTMMGGAASDVELTDKTSITEVMPFARYYYVNNDAFMLWAGLGVGFGFGTATDEYIDFDEDFNEIVGSDESKISTLSVGVGPGATIMLGEKCGLEISYGSLGFSSYKLTNEGADAGTSDDTKYEQSGFGLGWSNSFGFGISFAL